MNTIQLAHTTGDEHSHTETGEVQAAETKTVQSGFSPLTQTALFLGFMAVIAIGVIALRTTAWYRHKKR
jgi:hypothetical protein